MHGDDADATQPLSGAVPPLPPDVALPGLLLVISLFEIVAASIVCGTYACRGVSDEGITTKVTELNDAGVGLVQSADVPALLAGKSLNDALAEAIQAAMDSEQEAARRLISRDSAFPGHHVPPQDTRRRGASLAAPCSSQLSKLGEEPDDDRQQPQPQPQPRQAEQRARAATAESPGRSTPTRGSLHSDRI